MYVFFAFGVALFLTLVLTPGLIRVAGQLGIVDIPTARKVHTQPIPRCGGIVIAFVTLIPVLMWTPIDDQTLSCMIAAGIVLAIGVYDDAYSAHYGWRLLGQILASVIVMQAGVVLHLPFSGLDPALDYIITALFLVGLTNAVNLFDGLDGLAGGCAVLTLSAIALLGYQSGADVLVLRVFAIIGAIFGFLWYNTHPANVFMGDAGSNWLGFTIGALCILLLEQHGTAFNPAIAALFIGVPLLDLPAVVAQRLASGHSPFAADRRHLHHKILDFGIQHGQVVALIYVVQAAMVVSALALRYYSNTAVVGAYACMAVLVLGLHNIGWGRWPAVAAETLLRWRARIPSVAVAVLTAVLALYLLLGNLTPVGISNVYVAAAAAAHFLEHSAAIGVLLAFAVVLIAVIIICRRDPFRVTPQDFLIVFFAIDMSLALTLGETRAGETKAAIVTHESVPVKSEELSANIFIQRAGSAPSGH